MSDKRGAQEEGLDPVYVIESIPVAGEQQIPAQVIRSEAIPTPPHLVLYPELGRGGIGRIHPATDRNLLRHVALKRIDKKLAAVPMYREGFIAEAQMTGQLEHPNIVPVHELSVGEGGVPYFTMKLVQGIGLDKWLRDPFRLPGTTERLEEGLEIFLKVCDAVAYAHHRGVIHRDLKPENIMVAGFGQVYLMDWGLARLTKTRPASGARSQMEARGAVGTPDYMAPEQARGNPAEMDERSDIFGLGAGALRDCQREGPLRQSRDCQAILARGAKARVIPIDEAVGPLVISKSIRAIVDKAVASIRIIVTRASSTCRTRYAVSAGGLHLPRRHVRKG